MRTLNHYLMTAKLLVYCSIMLLITEAKAQQPVLYFDKLTTENGLSNNNINCILQDKRGFLWFGTNDGLNRYDGHNFLVFRHEPENYASISGNIITDMIEDANSVVWIATSDGGLTKYDYRLSPEKQFRAFKHLPTDSNSIPANIINRLLEDKQGYIWLASSGAGVFRFSKKEEKFSDPLTRNVNTALSISMDADGIVWAGREGFNMIRFNPVTMVCEIDSAYNNVYKRLPHVTVTTLYKDHNKNMWIGSWDKMLYRYNYATKKEETFNTATTPSFPEDEPHAFLEDEHQQLWVGGKFNGLHVFSKNANKFYSYQHDPSKQGTILSNTINCLYRDRNGNTWIGTSKGVSLYQPQQQQFEQVFLPPLKETKEPYAIYDLWQDDDTRIWIATSNGIIIWDIASKSFQQHPLNYMGLPLKITKFFKDKSGNFFVGTDYSLFRLDPANFRLTLLPNTENDVVMNKIIASRVVSIVDDSIDGHDVLLVSPYGHFFTYYDWQEKKWVSRTDTAKKILKYYGITDNLIRKFHKTQDGNIWLANTKQGLGRWQKKESPLIHYFQNNPLNIGSISNDNVFDIAEAGNGKLWVSTHGGGLHLFDPDKGTFTHIPATNNLLEGITTDKNGNVWMISNGNLQQYDTARKIQNSFELPDLEKTGGIKGYIFKDNNGYMYVTGNNYFIRFLPGAIRKERSQPSVIFTDFKIFGESYNQYLSRKEIALRYNENYFTINFAAPWFRGPDKIYYSYMLQGVDDKWIDAGTQTTAPYTNLNGGDYIFKVRATTTPGVWNEDIATLHIRIIPPFWKRAWFFLLCAVVIAAAIYAMYRYRINELLKREAMRNKIAQDLHDNVGSTLSSIAVYSEVAQYQQSNNDPRALQDVLQKIGNTSNEMISEMNDIVWAINPRNDSMEKILQRMDSFAKPLLAAQEIQFQFDVDPNVLHLDLDMEYRKNFYLVFKEAINNIIKYSGASKTTVKIDVKENHLVMAVSDNGKGFDPQAVKGKSKESLGGNGLRNMQLRAKDMKGFLTIESRPGEGTHLVLDFPV